MRQRLTAVVPTYCPDAAALEPLVDGLLGAGHLVVVSDDASPCTFDPVLDRIGHAGATVVRHRRNAGIARGLNDGLLAAIAAGSDWLLTVDQDTSIEGDHAAVLLQGVAIAERALGPGAVGAAAAGRISDASGPVAYPTQSLGGVLITEELIQTGTLWRVGALRAVGGFDESLGIDAVDAAACLALRRSGLRCIVVPDAGITHSLGSARQVRVLGRSVLITGHGPDRRSTIVRNRLRLFPAEFAASPRHAFRTIRRVAVGSALAVTVEDDRRAKAWATIRGVLETRSRATREKRVLPASEMRVRDDQDGKADG